LAGAAFSAITGSSEPQSPANINGQMTVQRIVLVSSALEIIGWQQHLVRRQVSFTATTVPL